MRLVQHKKEAFWFYRFLSMFYDNYVNPFFWTVPMRERSLDLARLEGNPASVVDVGSGTGFTTQGIVARVPADRVTCIDQSPHQMAHARRKSDLRDCTFLQGDAEALPFDTDRFDRYVSAGSIEYWPEPQRGITEAYRVVRPGGIALMIGPLRPQHPLGRWAADMWMLFPEEREYREWFERAGFTDIEIRYVRPHWVRREPYGIAIAGRKPGPGPSPLALGDRPMESGTEPWSVGGGIRFLGRLAAGSLAGFLFIPMALWGHFRSWVSGESRAAGDAAPRLTPHQRAALAVLAGIIALTIWWRI